MKYLEPEMEIIALESDDVIRTSVTNGGSDNGNNGGTIDGSGW